MTPRTEKIELLVNKNEVGVPVSYVLADDDGVAQDLTGHTLTFISKLTDTLGGTTAITETATGIEIQPTKSVTYDSATGKLFAYQHGLKYGMEVVFATTGTIFTGITAGRRYFVRNDVTPHYFSVAYEPEGTAITVSGGTSCTFKIVGHVVYTSQAGDFATVRTQYGWFYDEDSDGNKIAYPRSRYNNQGGGIEIVVR